LSDEEIPPGLRRYFRQVMAFPEGAVVHDGDCKHFSFGICTCGLLHQLMLMTERMKYYSKFYDDLCEQDHVLEHLQDTPPPPMPPPLSDEEVEAHMEMLKSIFKQ